MNRIFFTVGPSQIYPTVEKHFDEAFEKDVPSISHRGKEFKEYYKNTSDNLRTLLNIPNTHHIFFTGSSVESMERILENTVETHSFHLITGAFSKKFYQFAEQLGKKPSQYELPTGEKIDFSKIPMPKEAEIICITQNDTSNGIALPMKDIYALKKQHKDKLIAMDVVSSVPYVEIDFSQIDMAFFSVQKGFGIPAGLGLLIVNDKALAKTQALLDKGMSVGCFRNFVELLQKEKNYQTHETPNVLLIYVLGKVCEDMRKKGIITIREETEEKAALLYSFFEKSKVYEPLLSNPDYRSNTTIVINTKGETKKLLEFLSAKGFIVGSGYGENKENHIRIANFPAHTLEHTKKLLSLIKEYNYH